MVRDVVGAAPTQWRHVEHRPSVGILTDLLVKGRLLDRDFIDKSPERCVIFVHGLFR